MERARPLVGLRFFRRHIARGFLRTALLGFRLFTRRLFKVRLTDEQLRAQIKSALDAEATAKAEANAFKRENLSLQKKLEKAEKALSKAEKSLQKAQKSSAPDADAAARFVGAAAADAGRRHWPGALTVVAQGEGVRVPDHAWTRKLLARCGGALRVTSANLSGRRPATDAPQALADVGLSADLVIDDGISPGGIPSTVVKVLPDGTLQTLRP